MQPVPRAGLCTAGDAVASRAQRYAGADGLQGGGCKEAFQPGSGCPPMEHSSSTEADTDWLGMPRCLDERA